MIATALIMAGGRGERMARSGVVEPKPLVVVRGATLLEWNLRLLVRSGVERILVSLAVDDHVVRDAVATTLRPIGEAAGVEVDELLEDQPLGNIGALGLLAGRTEPVLVVYADNLTGIDLRAVVDAHRTSGADLTLAAHHEPFVMPFGELAVDAEDPARLVRYTEKPTYRPLVASAVIVAGPRASAHAAARGRLGISQLAQDLVDLGAPVRLWVHDAPWIDVNDRAALERAEALVDAHPEVFARRDLFEDLAAAGSQRAGRS